MKQFVFRVHRTRVDGKTVDIRLEPFTDEMRLHLNEGDEFVTGTLNSDPWEVEQ